MQVSKAARLWVAYHQANSKKNTVRAYEGDVTFLGNFHLKSLVH